MASLEEKKALLKTDPHAAVQAFVNDHSGFFEEHLVACLVAVQSTQRMLQIAFILP